MHQLFIMHYYLWMRKKVAFDKWIMDVKWSSSNVCNYCYLDLLWSFYFFETWNWPNNWIEDKELIAKNYLAEYDFSYYGTNKRVRYIGAGATSDGAALLADEKIFISKTMKEFTNNLNKPDNIQEGWIPYFLLQPCAII